MADVTRGDVLWHNAPFIALLNGTVSRGDPVATDATGWVRADSNGPIGCMGFALADGVSGDFIPICRECIQQNTTDLTTNGLLFLSATAGRIADAVVGAVASVTQCLGRVVRGAGTEVMYMNADLEHVQAVFIAAEASLVTTAEFAAFFIADRHYRVIGARERHSVAGTNGSAVTAQVQKVTSGTAKASGVNVLSTTFDLKSTADTPVWLGPSTTAADIVLVPGDALTVLSSGTYTALIDTTIKVTLVPNWL